MHLGMDLLFLVPGESGGRETYVRELLPALRAAAPDLRVTAFLNRETAAAGPGFWTEQADRAMVLPRASGRERGAWALAEIAALPRAAVAAGVEVLHSPANFAPLHGPFARVLTLHDLLYRERPELLSAPVRMVTAGLVRAAVQRAHQVITVSEASRAAIVRELPIGADRVHVVHNGLSGTPRAGDAARARARLRAGDRRVALAVATELPHKNLRGLLCGLAVMDPSERPLLALAGHGTDAGALPRLAQALGIAGDVRLLGAVGPGELEDLYAAAAVFVTSTLYEGFGLPVLEALARGVAVVCSDLPVLREVAGEVPVYVDPRDLHSIAAGLRAALAVPDDERREAGRRRAAGYDWRRAAEKTLAAYAAAEAASRSTSAKTRLV